MYPVLLKLGPLKIYSYGFMLVVAFYTGYYLLYREFRRLKMDPKLASDIVFFAAIGGIVGSKLYFLIENFSAVLSDPLGMIFSGSGLVFLGGLLGGMLGVTYVIRKNKLDWLQMGDVVAPLLILGYGIGRIGCFLVGDDYGFPTHLPWGIAFANGLPPSTYEVFQSRWPWIDLTGFEPGLLRVHPTQLYETFLALLIFAYLWSRRKFIQVTGSLFFTYLVLAGLERFVIEFIRTNSRYLWIFTGAQVLALFMMAAGGYYLIWNRRGSRPAA